MYWHINQYYLCIGNSSLLGNTQHDTVCYITLISIAYSQPFASTLPDENPGLHRVFHDRLPRVGAASLEELGRVIRSNKPQAFSSTPPVENPVPHRVFHDRLPIEGRRSQTPYQLGKYRPSNYTSSQKATSEDSQNRRLVRDRKSGAANPIQLTAVYRQRTEVGYCLLTASN